MADACVYTALMGEYETLNEQPAARRTDLDFVCLTDDPTLTSETWRVVRVDAAWPTDPVRSARTLKVLGHPALAGYARTVWIDNAVLLLSDPTFLLDTAGDVPVAALDHPWHEDVLTEFTAVLDQGLDDAARINEQLTTYLLTAPRVLGQRPFATNVMVRRRSPEVDATMRTWMDHILRYSRRDQLSFNMALALTGSDAVRLPGDPSRAGGWASWPHPSRRIRTSRSRSAGLSLPAAAVLRDALDSETRARTRTEATARELAVAEAALEADRALRGEDAAALAAAQTRIDDLEEDRWRFDQQREEAEMARTELEIHLEREREATAAAERAYATLGAELTALRASTSWRVTAPMRRWTERRRPAPEPD